MPAALVRRSQHAHILICRSCGDACIQQEASDLDHPAKRVRQALELAFLNGQKPPWNVRIVESGCLDICPVGKISVRLVGAEGQEYKTLTWTLSPEQDINDLIEQLRELLSRSS